MQGLIGINPVHSDRLLLSPVALAGLLATVLCGLDWKSTIHGRWHCMLYYLTMAMNPRFTITVNEAGEHVPVDVRVGQAVETVGQAGRPKTITGFQTHTTPVLMGTRDRAELVDDTYTAMTSVLEGVVVTAVNPNSVAKKEREAAAAAAAKAGAAKVTAVRTRTDLTWG